MKLRAYAKLNLYLEVLNRRPDNYHSIESIFHTISLCDFITLTPHKSDILFECNWKELPVDEKNLAVRAALRLREALGITKGARIRLEKNIPLGAGLGGGSSDAAAVLKGLLKLWKAELSQKKLRALAAGLGADVPFFLSGGTALVQGIGEKVRSLQGVKPACFLLIYPRVAVPTAKVYQRLRFPLPHAAGAQYANRNQGTSPLTNKQKITKMKILLTSGKSSPQWGKYLFNRLEEAVLPYYPQVMQARSVLHENGYPCIMSGSGSTVFAVIPSLREARGLQAKLRQYPWDIRIARSV